MTASESMERGTIADARQILGIRNVRTLEAMAARGEIPSAAKIGRRWTFSLVALRTFVSEREKEAWQNGERRRQAVSGTATSYGRPLWSKGNATGGALKQTIRGLRNKGAKRPSNGR